MDEYEQFMLPRIEEYVINLLDTSDILMEMAAVHAATDLGRLLRIARLGPHARLAPGQPMVGPRLGAALRDDKVTSALVAALFSPSGNLREAAARALGQAGRTKVRVVAALGAAMKDEFSGVRSAAVEALIEIGGAEVVPPLVAALRDNSEQVQQEAAEAFGRLGRADAEVVAALADAFKRSAYPVRRAIFDALSKLGRDGVLRDSD